MLAFGDLLGPPVVIADVEVYIADLLAIQLEDAADDAVGAWVLRPQIEHHLTFIDLLEEVRAGECRMSAGIIEGVGRHFGGAEGVLLAQGMTLPIVGHQDAPQVGVAAEVDAEHVEHLPLVPVGGREDWGDAGRVRLLPRQFGFDADIAGLVKGEQVVVEGEVPVAGPVPPEGFVHGGDVFQALEGRAGALLQVPQKVGDELGRRP